jgi:pimeloyl-ACP methyl ester carboxylesterase
MANFVLLHGAFHGAWCWRDVAARLRGAGHAVTTPTQTGLGERRHLLSGTITLETFVEDLVQHLENEEITDSVLVGHSFGGHAITGAADRVPERIRHLVYLDAALLENGETPFSRGLPENAVARERDAQALGGFAIPPPSPEAFGVPAGPGADWVARMLCPHPLRTFQTPLMLRNKPGNGLPATYVCCTEPLYANLESSRVRARVRPGMAWRELATGHDAMVTAPEATADLLMEIAP